MSNNFPFVRMDDATADQLYQEFAMNTGAMSPDQRRDMMARYEANPYSNWWETMAEDRKPSALKQIRDLILPIAAIASAAYLGRKGWKALAANPGGPMFPKEAARPDLKRELRRKVRDAETDLMYQLGKKIDNYKGIRGLD